MDMGSPSNTQILCETVLAFWLNKIEFEYSLPPKYREFSAFAHDNYGVGSIILRPQSLAEKRVASAK